MTRRWLLVAVLVLVGTCLTPAGAAAYIPPPARSYTISAGEFVFVMIGPLGWPYYDDNANPETAAIRAVYPRSGMYRNDGSATLIWPFGEPNSYVYRDNIFVFPDGVHLVVHCKVAQDPDHGLLSFYARGERIGGYSARELLSWPGLVPSMPKFAGQRLQYKYLEAVGFDREKLECTARTYDGNWYVFDLRTGRIVSRTRWSLWVGVALSAVLAVVAWLSFRFFRKRRHKRAAAIVPAQRHGSA
ncbi:hypothetical protein [Urbifossiella limnaea]|uniref:Uncharacterized protein n=1 Tax=Urbifossiella limnaea TaxID=2528023 RepID=A0A517XXH1_9BACT|nr:hypothetical protein [Urbifossiella limnaea]QDU22161.1 hypothetical protein ETAA1_41370 [Urbifossiella limnaea]